MITQGKCGQQAGRPHEMDELLERVWTLKEQGKDSKLELLSMTPIENSQQWLDALVREKLVVVDKEKVVFTQTGEMEAQGILRRHRLAERLFADVFHTSEEVWEREACELEHKSVLTEEAINAVCAFLGHPPTCPHGRPIPRGECCDEFGHDIKPFVIPLSETRLSDRYRIVFITPKNHMRLDRLAVLGILPGSDLHVHQKKPSYVIRVGETDIALDPEIVRDIYVKKVS